MKWISIIDTIVKVRRRNILINAENVKVKFNIANSPNNEVIKIIKNNTILLFIAWYSPWVEPIKEIAVPIKKIMLKLVFVISESNVLKIENIDTPKFETTKKDTTIKGSNKSHK